MNECNHQVSHILGEGYFIICRYNNVEWTFVEDTFGVRIFTRSIVEKVKCQKCSCIFLRTVKEFRYEPLEDGF
jgi:hypothetical protein